MNTIFSAHGAINKRTLGELWRYFVPAFFTWLVHGLGIFLIVLFLFLGNYTVRFFVLCSIILIVYYLIALFLAKLFARQKLMMLHVLFDTREVRYTLQFKTDGIYIYYKEDKHILVPYSNIHVLGESKHYYLLLNEGGLPLIIDKTSLFEFEPDWKEMMVKKYGWRIK